MRLAAVVFSFAILTTILVITVAAAPDKGAVAPDKILIIDGSMVHDVGQLHLNITNFGLLGSRYSSPSSFSHAPSARWPGTGGIDHLWAAGLWVGGIQLGERLVTTGQYEMELLASDAPEDVIYELAWDAPAAARYPLPAFDDDQDGAEDEDPFNGRDDDGDGAVDEDAAGVGDQHFRAEMSDVYSADVYPDHTPLNLEVVQQTYQWTHEDIADIVGVEYTIGNNGVAPIEAVYVGMFSDFDINDPPGPGEAGDDQVGYIADTVEAYPGRWVDVEVTYAYEGLDRTVSGYMGWVLLDHPTDPAGVTAPTEVGLRSFQRFSGQVPYDQGGDPTNDMQRYELLSDAHFDNDSIHPNDYRHTFSVGPFAELPVGGEIQIAFALVAGADLAEMTRNAGRARLLYDGQAFDRDGDPGNGDEFIVNWLGPEDLSVGIEDPGDPVDDTPVVLRTVLSASPNPFNPTLEVKAILARGGLTRVSIVDVRGREIRVLHDGNLAGGDARWLWNGRDASGQLVASGVYLVRLETEQRVTQRAVTLVK